MGIEKMNFQNAAELPVSDNRIQIELARIAYRHENSDDAAPTKKKIMDSWLKQHAANYRKVVEAQPEAKLKMGDDEALEEWYKRVLAAHEPGGTMH